MGRRVKADVIREHWGEIIRLVASLKAGTVLPSAMLKRLAAYQCRNQLDLALQELGRVERTLYQPSSALTVFPTALVGHISEAPYVALQH